MNSSRNVAKRAKVVAVLVVSQFTEGARLRSKFGSGWPRAKNWSGRWPADVERGCGWPIGRGGEVLTRKWVGQMVQRVGGKGRRAAGGESVVGDEVANIKN